MLSSRVRKLLLCENVQMKKLFNERKIRREIWVHEIFRNRPVLGEFHRMYEQLRTFPIKFAEYARMQVETFDYILNKIESRIQKQQTFLREPIGPKERLFVTLRYLSTGISMRALAFSFRIAESTLRKIIPETCSAVWEELNSTHMIPPDCTEYKKIAHDFYEKSRFPNCIGAIDGKHCRIKCPKNSGSDYFNYKKFFSIVLQGVADSNCKFIFIELGFKGSQSDGGIFAASRLQQAIIRNELDIPSEEVLPNSDIKAPFVFIGDEAYPLTKYLMRPYPRRSLTEPRFVFNERLSSARRCVECAFGILTEKWRLMKREIDVTPKKAIILIKAMCLLHNIIIDVENIYDYFYTFEGETSTYNSNKDLSKNNNRSKNEAKPIRESLLSFFLNKT
ncbi:protein ALP1-like isoform X4 [Drosophila miranda]|uniref:protein ALP1-like isoform X4 n=1 Tax=Drosophila miranda TaxID=7229 RepID=UPI00143F9B1C|nr:protein ALP1-like isoform X4 [Drosophila miranda]